MAPAHQFLKPKAQVSLNSRPFPAPVPPQLSVLLSSAQYAHLTHSPHISSSGHHQSPKLSTHLTCLSFTHSPLKVMCPTPLYTHVHTSHMHTHTSDTHIWVCTRIAHANIVHTGMHIHDAPHSGCSHHVHTGLHTYECVHCVSPCMLTAHVHTHSPLPT